MFYLSRLYNIAADFMFYCPSFYSTADSTANSTANSNANSNANATSSARYIYDPSTLLPFTSHLKPLSLFHFTPLTMAPQHPDTPIKSIEASPGLGHEATSESPAPKTTASGKKARKSSTEEPPNTSDAEHKDLIRRAVLYLTGRFPALPSKPWLFAETKASISHHLQPPRREWVRHHLNKRFFEPWRKNGFKTANLIEVLAALAVREVLCAREVEAFKFYMMKERIEDKVEVLLGSAREFGGSKTIEFQWDTMRAKARGLLAPAAAPGAAAGVAKGVEAKGGSETAKSAASGEIAAQVVSKVKPSRDPVSAVPISRDHRAAQGSSAGPMAGSQARESSGPPIKRELEDGQVPPAPKVMRRDAGHNSATHVRTLDSSSSNDSSIPAGERMQQLPSQSRHSRTPIMIDAPDEKERVVIGKRELESIVARAVEQGIRRVLHEGHSRPQNQPPLIRAPSYTDRIPPDLRTPQRYSVEEDMRYSGGGQQRWGSRAHGQQGRFNTDLE